MKYQKADKRVPNMGLNGLPCSNPKYWCRLHEIWLSEDDVENKHCRCKPTMDMIGVQRCTNLEQKDYAAFLERISR